MCSSVSVVHTQRAHSSLCFKEQGGSMGSPQSVSEQFGVRKVSDCSLVLKK